MDGRTAADAAEGGGSGDSNYTFCMQRESVKTKKRRACVCRIDDCSTPSSRRENGKNSPKDFFSQPVRSVLMRLNSFLLCVYNIWRLEMAPSAGGGIWSGRGQPEKRQHTHTSYTSTRVINFAFGGGRGSGFVEVPLPYSIHPRYTLKEQGRDSKEGRRREVKQQQPLDMLQMCTVSEVSAVEIRYTHARAKRCNFCPHTHRRA